MERLTDWNPETVKVTHPKEPKSLSVRLTGAQAGELHRASGLGHALGLEERGHLSRGQAGLARRHAGAPERRGCASGCGAARGEGGEG